jgi:glycosyltransferase involved in cell wall biosynthesis
MERTRVVHLLPNLNTGGAQVFTVNLLKAINPRRYERILITLSTPEPGNRLAQELEETGITYYSLGKQLGFNVKTIFHIRSLLHKLKPDVLHTHMHTLKYLSFAQLGHESRPWVHTVHTPAASELLYLERKIASYLFRRKAVIPIAVSHHVAHSIEKVYHITQTEVIYNRIPIHKKGQKVKSYYRNKLSLPVRATLLISVARLAPAKNQAMLLEAFSRVSTKHPDVHLILIGGGPMRRTLETQAMTLNVHSRVVFTGMVLEPVPFLRSADIFVLSSNREGLPVGVLEAMREGLPIVATKAGGVPEVVDDSVNGYLVDIGDVDALARALEKLMKSDRRTEFGKNAQNKIRAVFDITLSARAYEKVYEREVNKK